jgi:hypothetical protein
MKTVKKILRALLILTLVVFALIFWGELDSITNYKNPSWEGDGGGLFFTIRAVRFVSEYKPNNLEKLDDFDSYQQIEVRFLGIVPVNCLISKETQPEDRCAIYRYNWGEDGFFAWESQGPVRAYWRWSGDRWVRQTVSPRLVKLWEDQSRGH